MGANVNERRDVELDDTSVYEQVTALHVACDSGHLKVVRLLLDRGADVNAKCARSFTPFAFCMS
jgi:ankyrin repeat protein